VSKKKGLIKEIISRAVYLNELDKYDVSYRDFEDIVTVPLREFMRISENLEIIPITRIDQIKRDSCIIYKKFKR
jgi:phosphatidylserine decarboxylase